MKYYTRNETDVTYLYDYGTLTKDDYAIFDDEKRMVKIILNFKNSYAESSVIELKEEFIKLIKEFRDNIPNSLVVPIPSSKVDNNKRIIDSIADEFNQSKHRVLERTYDIESAHYGGHSDLHYSNFRKSLQVNNIGQKNIILIDDICTSGRTIDLCKEVLELSGNKVAAVCTVAKTVSNTNLKDGYYTFEVDEIMHEDDHKLSIRFSTGDYIRTKNEYEFQNMFMHTSRFVDFNYSSPKRYSELPTSKKMFVKIYTENGLSKKKICAVFKNTNFQVNRNIQKYPMEKGMFYSLVVKGVYRNTDFNYSTITIEGNNLSIKIMNTQKVNHGNAITVEYLGKSLFIVREIME